MAAFNLNGFNIGTDFSAVMLDNYGDVFPLDALGLLMEFDSESLDRELEVVPITGGGVPLFMTIWAGVRGRMMFTRNGPNFNQMANDLMTAYFSAGIIPIFTIQAQVLNRNGSVDEYQYSGVQLSKPRNGNFRAEKEVDMAIEFRASQLISTGAYTPFLTGVAAAAA